MPKSEMFLAIKYNEYINAPDNIKKCLANVFDIPVISKKSIYFYITDIDSSYDNCDLDDIELWLYSLNQFDFFLMEKSSEYFRTSGESLEFDVSFKSIMITPIKEFEVM